MRAAPRCRRTTRSPVAALLLVLLCVAAGAIAGCSRRADSARASASSSPVAAVPCAPTSPNGDAPPGEKPSRWFHGNGQIWTVLWPRGTVVFAPGGPGEIRADGSLVMKFPFWRGAGVTGELAFTGRSLEGADEPMTGEATAGYGDQGFQASSLTFPRPGCWEVTARVGQVRLTFVTRVVRRQ